MKDVATGVIVNGEDELNLIDESINMDELIDEKPVAQDESSSNDENDDGDDSESDHDDDNQPENVEANVERDSSGDESIHEQNVVSIEENESSEKTISDIQIEIDQIDLDEVDFVHDVQVEEKYEKAEEDKVKIVLSSSEDEKLIEKDEKEVDEDLPMEYPTHVSKLPIGDQSKYNLSHLSEVEKLEVEIEELKRRIDDSDNLFNNFGLTSSEVVDRQNRLLTRHLDLKQTNFDLRNENEKKDKFIEDLSINLKNKDEVIKELADQNKLKEQQIEDLLKELDSLKNTPTPRY